MLQVGIHSNVVIEKAVINDKGTLEIHTKKVGEETENELDMFNSAAADAGVGGDGQVFMEFNPLQTNRFNADLEAPAIIADINNFRNKLSHIVLQYKPENKIKWDIFRGTGITDKAGLNKKVLDQGILDMIYKNICEDFIKNIADVDNSKHVHLKLIRQSKAKHFPKLPDSRFGFTGMNAFIQDGALPCTLKYSKYELGYRKDDADGQPSGTNLANPNPIQADDDQNTGGSSAGVEDDPFGNI